MVMAGMFLLIYHNITPHHHEAELVHDLRLMHHAEGPLEQVNVDHHFYHDNDLVNEIGNGIVTLLYRFDHFYVRPETAPPQSYVLTTDDPFPPDPFLSIPDHRGPPHC